MTEATTGTSRHSHEDRRRRWLAGLGIAVVILLLAYGLYWVFYARYFESTDDAYVGGDVIAITSREPASVLAIHADNTQSVRAGQLLVELDPVSAKVAMQAAEANLARTIRKVRGEFADADKLADTVTAARVSLEQAQSDYRRRLDSSRDGAVSGEEIQHARDAVAGADAALRSADSAREEELTAIQGTSVANNPDVLAAIAQVRSAAITLSHMRLYAPADGIVAQRTVQVGQQVAVGTPLMAVVPLESAWIDANFKEGQLERMRVGQPVTATADIYGSGIVFHGRIEGLGAGSGSAFALLPPQNASGNWIKIVQRVPVRIALDPKELRAHPLRIGLSMTVNVDVRDQSGPLITTNAVSGPSAVAPSDAVSAATDALVARILAANGADAGP